MNTTDANLKEQLRKNWPRHETPLFDEVWAKAERARTAQRRRYAGMASLAAAAALAAIVFGGGPAVEEPRYIEMADVLDTTYWAAPSDTLMPEHRFDIYQEMPVLFEST
ncbi:MAG: hypothetical protein GWN47_01925 [Woeseiaceae bacterium]|nr:hypothetical protein [Woeseiaceae bacterium]